MSPQGRGGRLRFAVDTGGTFTDLIVADESGDFEMFKASTQPDDPVAGVLAVMGAAAEAAGEPLADYLARGEILVHGTTHAINAIVTGSTARTAFLTTAGPSRHAGLGARAGAPKPSTSRRPIPSPIIPKALTFEIPERIIGGRLRQSPLDEAATVRDPEAAAAELRVEAVAVCLLWSIVNPRARDWPSGA